MDNPESLKRFDGAAMAVILTGVMMMGLGVVAPVYLAMQQGQVDREMVTVLIGVGVVGIISLCAGLALRRKRPWARLATVLLCSLGLLLLIGAGVYVLFGAAKIVLILHDGIKANEWAVAKGYSTAQAAAEANRQVYWLYGGLALGTMFLLVVLGLWVWKLLKMIRYFRSDEVKSICGHGADAAAPGKGSV